MDAIDAEEKAHSQRKRGSLRRTPTPASTAPSSPQLTGKQIKLGSKRRRFAGKSAKTLPKEPRSESTTLDANADQKTLSAAIPAEAELSAELLADFEGELEHPAPSIEGMEWEPDLLPPKPPLLGDPGVHFRPALEDIDWTPATPDLAHTRSTSYTTAFISPTATAFHQWLIPVAGEETSGMTPTTPITPDLWKYISISMQNKLGEGAFGKVYLAKDKASGKTYAVKQGIPKPGSDLANEIRHLLSLKEHPNLVRIEGYAAEDKTFKLLMEYCDGGSVRSLYYQYCQGSLSEKLTGHLMKQVLSGVAFLHSQSMVHRDLKGANILVSRKGVVKIADFGLARKVKVDVNTSSSSLPAMPTDSGMSMHKGSWLWMPPESFIKSEPRGLALDIWSFGCVLMECCTGHVPWHPMQAETVLYNLREGTVPLHGVEVSEDVCGDELQHLMEDCLNWSAANRPTAQACLEYPFIANAVILTHQAYVEEIKRVKKRNKRRAARLEQD